MAIVGKLAGPYLDATGRPHLHSALTQWYLTLAYTGLNTRSAQCGQVYWGWKRQVYCI